MKKNEKQKLLFVAKELEKLSNSIKLETRQNIKTYDFIYWGGRMIFANAAEVDAKIRDFMRQAS